MSRFLFAIPLFALATTAAAADPAQDMAARMDRFLGERWAQAGVQPAAPADDATFMRRIYLDLLGRIPAGVEVDRILRMDFYPATDVPELALVITVSG